MTKSDSWYKQFWPWFLIFFPLLAVVAGIATLFIALDKKPVMVEDEYYKKGKAINLDLSKYRKAKELNLAFNATFTSEDFILKSITSDTEELAAIKVNLYHPTQDVKDRVFMITADAAGNYRHRFEKEISGPWDMTISAFDNSWKIKKRISLPSSESIDFSAN